MSNVTKRNAAIRLHRRRVLIKADNDWEIKKLEAKLNKLQAQFDALCLGSVQEPWKVGMSDE